MADARNIIIRDLFTKECALEVFMNKPVLVKCSQEVILEGVINGTFGKSGKQKVSLKESYSGDISLLEKAEVELRLKVHSKELSKLRNIK